MTVSARTMGADYSAYQGKVDWHQQRAAGIRFAAIKATEGLAYQDAFFYRNWQQTYNHSIMRLAYHFLHADEDGIAQCDYFHAYVHKNGRFRWGDGVLLDFETLDKMPVPQALDEAERFVLRARASIAKQVVLYTYVDFWMSLLDAPLRPVLASCPLWIADYGVLLPPKLPNLPSPAFWQFSSTGQEPGVDGNVDLDLFFGNLAQLQLLLKWAPAPALLPPPAPVETIPSGQFGKFGANPDAPKMQ